MVQRGEQVIAEFKDLTQDNIYIFRYIFLHRNPSVCWMKDTENDTKSDNL